MDGNLEFCSASERGSPDGKFSRKSQCHYESPPSAFPSKNQRLNAENYDILNNYCELQIAGSDIPEVLELQMANLTKHCDVIMLQTFGEQRKVHRMPDDGFQWYWETQTKAKRELIHRSLSTCSVQNNAIYYFCHQLFSNKKYPASIEGLSYMLHTSI